MKLKGFTLIEVLVVISVFVVLSTILLSILVTVIRGSRKSDSIIAVRQDGDHAMDQIIRVLRFAKSLAPACSAFGIGIPSVTITSAVDLSQSTFSCPAIPSSPITMNSTNLTNSAITAVNSCNFVCTQSASGPPTIGVFFNLSKKNPSGLIEDNTNIPFQSSVTLRNIGN